MSATVIDAVSAEMRRLTFGPAPTTATNVPTAATTVTTATATACKQRVPPRSYAMSPSPCQSPSQSPSLSPSTSPSSHSCHSRHRSRSQSPQPRTRVSSSSSPPTQLFGAVPLSSSSPSSLASSGNGCSDSYSSIRVDADGNTRLIIAASSGNFVEVEKALAAGASKCVDEQNYRGETALFGACLARRAITAEVLLARGGADANICNADGASPLHVAASLDSERLVRALLGAGANPRARDDEGDTPLHWAIRERAERAARAIVECAGPEVILLRNEDGETAADLAAEVGDSEAATWLGLAAAAIDY